MSDGGKMYDKKSNKAEEFINHEEIMETLEYGEKNSHNRALIKETLEKAAQMKGLNHRDAFLLLSCEEEDLNKEIINLARKIKRKFYGHRIVLFAPLYLSNYCVNGCVYCPYHTRNKNIIRKKLSLDEIREEVIALQDMGHKRLALEAGEDPKNFTMDYLIECINTIYSIHHKNGDIRRVNVNVAATTVENYTRLKNAGIGTYILFQETYHKQNYELLHPYGPKHNYAYHTEAMDRAMEGGIDDVGVGVLFGLNNYRYDFVGLLMHAEHLEARFGVGPHTISVPRIRPADDIDPADFDNSVNDEIFEKMVAMIRVSTPYTGMIMSTRETARSKQIGLDVGISQISGGSKTSVGGYAADILEQTEGSEQFDTIDKRTLDDVISWLLDMGYVPSFCTACYREGRTGDRFMSIVKSGQLQNICQPNALLTLTEYLEDYATPETKRKGYGRIPGELLKIEREASRKKTAEWIENIKNGKRDLHF